MTKALENTDFPSVAKDLPTVVFALRFGNDDGFVQKYFAQHRDLAAGRLQSQARFVLAFKALGRLSAYKPIWSKEIELDFYDWRESNKKRIAEYIVQNNVKVLVFQGASPDEINIRFYKNLGVLTMNTEDTGFEGLPQKNLGVQVAKILLRRILKINLHKLYIANSEGQVDSLLRYAKLPKNRIRLVSCGIDTDFYTPGDRSFACQRLGLDPQITWIMAAAQSRPEKRIDKLIKVASKVMESRPQMPIGFFYVGGGELLQEWRSLAEQNLPSGRWVFFGRQRDLRLFYQAASIFVHGSIRESFGLVLTEAMASGLPIVATEAAGPNEIILHERNGALVKRDDWESFANAVLRYIDSIDLRSAHGASGRQRCINSFSIERASDLLAESLRIFI